MRVLQGLRQYDENEDWKLDEEEAGSLSEQLSELCSRYNQGLLKRFYTNEDDLLDEDEVAEAKKQMEERRSQGGGGRGGGR